MRFKLRQPFFGLPEGTEFSLDENCDDKTEFTFTSPNGRVKVNYATIKIQNGFFERVEEREADNDS